MARLYVFPQSLQLNVRIPLSINCGRSPTVAALVMRVHSSLNKEVCITVTLLVAIATGKSHCFVYSCLWQIFSCRLVYYYL